MTSATFAWLSSPALLWVSALVLLLNVGVCLMIARGWRRIAQLRDSPLPQDSFPRVSLIVAALNEAATIAPALQSLLAIEYPALEIIVVDDRSTDATPAIVDRLAEGDARLRVLHVDELPAGWLGKNHALARGAAIATGNFLLFTDADAVFAPDAVARAVAVCQAQRLDHLALLFDIVAGADLLRLMILGFVTGFMARFQPWRVGSSRRHYIGVGGFNLVRAEAYRAIGGHAALPLAVLDDLMLGKLLKAHGYRQQVLFGTGMVTIAWYASTPALFRGLEKNIFAGFSYRVSVLLLVTALSLVTRIWPWLALVTTAGAARWINLASIGVGLALSVDLLRERGWSLRCLLWSPLLPWLELALWWNACLRTLLQGGVAWRGTRYRLAQLRAAHRQLEQDIAAARRKP